MAYTINPKLQDLRGTIRSGYLGSAGGNAWVTATELNKPLKLADKGFALATDGDEIWGFLNSVNPSKVDNFYFGGAVCEGVVIAQVIANGSTVAIGDCIIAATNAGLGTANPDIGTERAVPIVKLQGSPAAGKKYWRVVDLRGGSGVQATLISILFE
jgi:hypothetical protein